MEEKKEVFKADKEGLQLHALVKSAIDYYHQLEPSDKDMERLARLNGGDWSVSNFEHGYFQRIKYRRIFPISCTCPKELHVLIRE